MNQKLQDLVDDIIISCEEIRDAAGQEKEELKRLAIILYRHYREHTDLEKVHDDHDGSCGFKYDEVCEMLGLGSEWAV